MKKKILLLFILMFIPVVAFADDTYYENYFGIRMTDKEYNNLLQLGFSEREIYLMSEKDFNYNKDIEASLEAKTTNYYVNIIRYDVTGKIISNSDMQITEEDYMNEGFSTMTFSPFIETEYKRLTTTIAKAGSYYRFKVNLFWKIMPATRSYDIIGIGFEPNVYIPGDLNFSMTYCSLNICMTTDKINNDSINPSGAGVSFLLPPSNKVTDLESTLYFDVNKYSDIIVYDMIAYGDYSHATKSIASNLAYLYNVNQSGVDLSEKIESYYDSIECATAEWYGTW